MNEKLLIGVVYHDEYIHQNTLKDFEKLSKKYQNNVKFAISCDNSKSDIKINGVETILADKHYGSPVIPRYNLSKYAVENNIPYMYTYDRDDWIINLDKLIQNMLYNIENHTDKIYFAYKFNVDDPGYIPTIKHQVIKSDFFKSMFEKHLINYPTLQLCEDNITEIYFGYRLNSIDVDTIEIEQEIPSDLDEFKSDKHLTNFDMLFSQYDKDCFKDMKKPTSIIKYVYEQLVCNNDANPGKFGRCTRILLKNIYERNKNSEYFSGYDLYCFFKYYYYVYMGRAWWDSPYGRIFLNKD